MKLSSAIPLIGIALAAGFVAGYLKPHRNNDDDIPVVVAGGSMHIVTQPAFYFDATTSSVLTFNASTRYLTEADISYPSGALVLTDNQTFTGANSVSLTLGYCNPGRPCTYPSADDTVTVATGANRTNLTITGSQPNQWLKIFDHHWKRQPHNWKLSWVHTSSGTHDCGPNAECSVLIHQCANPDPASCHIVK
jgi:hypothetical protein